MKSMTGYGRGSVIGSALTVSVELSTVNHRQLDLRLDLPSGTSFIEPELRRLLRAGINRGSAYCRVTTVCSSTHAGFSGIDKIAVAGIITQIRRLARQLKLSDDLRASHLLELPGLLLVPPSTGNPELLLPPLRKAVKKALVALNRMRFEEGRALSRDLALRLKKTGVLVQRIDRRAPLVAAREHRQLLNKIKALKSGCNSALPDRVEREIVAGITRGDITEELTRLRSHLRQAESLLNSSKPIGRTLDFLLQEMNREINTIGAKAGDTAIARLVVQIKTELDRVREQTQNIE